MTPPVRATTRDHFSRVLMSLGVPPPTYKQVAGIRQHLFTWGRDRGAGGERKVAGGAFRVVLAAFLHDRISGEKPESSCRGVSAPCRREGSCGFVVWESPDQVTGNSISNGVTNPSQRWRTALSKNILSNYSCVCTPVKHQHLISLTQEGPKEKHSLNIYFSLNRV